MILIYRKVYAIGIVPSTFFVNVHLLLHSLLTLSKRGVPVRTPNSRFTYVQNNLQIFWCVVLGLSL